MATKEDLTEQLDLMGKLAAQVERMAQAQDRGQQAYGAQIDAAQKLAAVIGQVDTQRAVQGITALSQSLKDMQSQMKGMGRSSGESLKRLGDQVAVAGKAVSQRFPKSLLIGVAALTGFGQGIKNVVALGSGLTGFVTSAVDGMASLAAAIIAIPFKVFESLVDLAASSAGGSNELAQAIENLRKEFGYLYGPTNHAIIETAKSLKGFSDTGLSAWRVFGYMAQRLELLQKLASGMGATFTSVRVEFEKNGGALLAYQKGLGLSEEEMKAVAQVSVSMGDTLAGTLKETTKYSLEMAKAFSLDGKVISRDMGKAMQDVGHFAGATIKEIAQAATYARKLGLELDKVTGTLDAFETFDTAAENVAKLSQSFGVQADAFELLKAQDPAEQIDILRKSFAKAGVDASTFNRQQLKLLSTTTGLDEATARQAFSLKNQGIGLDQIKKKGEDAEKKTLTQAQAMAKLADAIERLVMSGGGLRGGFWDMFVKGINDGIMSTKEFWELMRNIRVALMDVYFVGVKLGRELVKIVPGFQELLQGLADFFKPAYFTKLFQGISDSARRFLDPKSPDKGSIPALVEHLKDTIENMFTVEGSAGKRVLDGFKKFFTFASRIAAAAITWLSDKVAEGARYVVDLLTGKRTLNLAGAAGVGAGGLGFMHEVLAPLGEALAHAWNVLEPPLKELVMTLGHKLLAYLKSDEFLNIIRPALPYVAGILFGPAFTRALLGGITAGFAKAATAGLAPALGRAIRGLASQAAAAEKAAQVATAGGNATPGLDQVAAVNKAAGRAVDGGRGWGIKDAVALGAKLVAIATALAAGGVMMAFSVATMKRVLENAGVKTTKDVLPPLEMLGAMVVAALPLAAALRIVSKTTSIADVAQGGLIISAAVALVGAVSAGVAWLMSKAAKPEELVAAGNLMAKMALVFLAVIPLLAVATAIGALVTGPQAAVLAATAVGFGVLIAAVSAMAGAAAGIAKELAALHVDSTFQPKIDAFLGIMKSIESFTGTLVGLVSLMTPSFTELISGKATSFANKVDASTKLLKQMVGERGGGTGLIGLVELIIDSVRGLGANASILQAAQAMASVMEAAAAALKALAPPDAFFEAGSSFLNRLTNPTYDFMNLAHDVSQYVSNMREAVMSLLRGDSGSGGLLGVIKDLAGLNVDEKAASAAGQLLQATAGIIQAITPNDATVRAFQTGTEKSALWGALKASTTKLDVGAIKQYFDSVGEQMKVLIPTLTSGVLTAVSKQASALSPDQLSGLKTMTDVLRTATDLMNGAAAISKSVPEGGVDSTGIDRIARSFPSLASSLGSLSAAVGSAIKSGGELRDLQANMTTFARVIGGSDKDNSGVVGALKAVSDMVARANELDKALSDGNIGKIDVKARLERVARGVGLGGKVSYTVNPNKEVVVNLNLQVFMDVDKVERVMIMRKQSIIRDRLNYATGDGTAGRPGNPPIPGEYQDELPQVSGGTR